MSYLTQSAISGSYGMIQRVAQCAAAEADNAEFDGDPDVWTYENRRTWAAAPGWDAAWESAMVGHPDPAYDPGMDEAVITDGMILAAVQSLLPEPAA